MLLVQANTVGFIRVESRISAGDKCAADSDLCSKPDNGGGDMRGGKGINGGMDIAWV